MKLKSTINFGQLNQTLLKAWMGCCLLVFLFAGGVQSRNCMSWCGDLRFKDNFLKDSFDVDEIIFRVSYLDPFINLYRLHSEDGSQHLVDGWWLQNSFELAADGTTSLVFKSYVSGLFTIRDVGPAIVSGSLTVVDTSGGYVVETYYTAPETYDPDNDVVYLDYYISPGNTEPTITFKLNIKPPPVILLHGLASEGIWWNPIKNSLQDQGWPSNFIATPDYDNDGAFSTQTAVVKNAIDFQLLNLRTSDVFVNKVNLVGYSMGGLLGRQYLLENPDAPVYKFVTLNTPHYGSEWANLVDGQSYQGSFYWLADRWFSNTVDGFDIDGGAMNSLRVDGDAILNLNSQAGPTLPIHAISTDFTACDFFYDSYLPVSPSSIRSISKLIRIGSGALNFIYFLGAAVCAGIDHVLGEEHDGIVRVASQSGGLQAPYHQNYAGVINSFHTATANQANIKNEHLPTLLRVSPDESGLFTTGGFVPDTLPPPNLLPGGEDARSNRLLTEVEIDILHPQPNDTVYAQWVPLLQVAGSEEVAGLMAFFFYPALDTMLTDSVLWSNSHSFTVPVPQDYEGWVNIGVLGTDGYGTVDFDTLSVYVTQSALPIPEIPQLLQPADGSTSLPLEEVALEWEEVGFAQAYRLEVSDTPDFAELIFEQSDVAETTTTLSNLNISTTYYWRVRAENSSGEGSWSETWAFTTETANSTTDNAKRYGLRVYPNPTKEVVLISCSHRIQSVQLFDGTGRMVTSRVGDQPTIELALQGIPSGIYFVKVRLELGEVWEKIAVKP
jgi:pimeloyl-ACP methyl ester carboxylesterase